MTQALAVSDGERLTDWVQLQKHMKKGEESR